MTVRDREPGEPMYMESFTEEQNRVWIEFQNMYYRHWAKNLRRWMGVHIVKYPNDLFMYQQVLHDRRPEVIVETGTYKGGGTLFFAHMFDLLYPETLQTGQIMTVDFREIPHRPHHPRIHYVTGRCTTPEVLNHIKDFVRGRTCMVVLDSNHTTQHVKRELYYYSKFVTDGQYIVAEDTSLGGHPVMRMACGPGPKPAVDWFMRKTRSFRVDPVEKRMLISQHPGGWLLRTKGNPKNEA